LRAHQFTHHLQPTSDVLDIELYHLSHFIRISNCGISRGKLSLAMRIKSNKNRNSWRYTEHNDPVDFAFSCSRNF
jgi:hypothetical protein